MVAFSMFHGPGSSLIEWLPSLATLLAAVLIGPDHLCSLIALSTSLSGWPAFRAGAAWGVGHTASMVCIGLLLSAVLKCSHRTLLVYEHFADYAVGASLILVGLYFLAYQSKFMRQEIDGSFTAVPCGCCEASVPMPIANQPARFCASYGSQRRMPTSPALNHQQSEETWSTYLLGERGFQGIVVGMIQGVFCPMSLIGVGILSAIGSSADLFTVIVFLLLFLGGSLLGSGLLTLLWGSLTSSGHLGPFVNKRTLFRGSCWFTIALGTLWIISNRAGLLPKLNYAEKLHADSP